MMRQSSQETFESGVEKTVDWYLESQEWVNNVISGDCRHWFSKHYADLGKELA
jgi:dTDP-glucose 4,6-dehydratase